VTHSVDSVLRPGRNPLEEGAVEMPQSTWRVAQALRVQFLANVSPRILPPRYVTPEVVLRVPHRSGCERGELLSVICQK
jgi:hypothetical protein